MDVAPAPNTGVPKFGFTVKLLALEAVPAGVTTVIAPVVPAPRTAVICVDELIVYDVAFVAPNLTAVAPVKLVPVITAVVEFAQPFVGVKLVIVGTAVIHKLLKFISPVPPVLVLTTLT